MPTDERIVAVGVAFAIATALVVRRLHGLRKHRSRESAADPSLLKALEVLRLPEQRFKQGWKSRLLRVESDVVVEAVDDRLVRTPLLCLVNPKSGTTMGKRLISQLRSMLNKYQVIDLTKEKPVAALRRFSEVPDLRVLVAGGDGTIGWVLSSMDEVFTEENRPLVTLLPVGTGNDLCQYVSKRPGWLYDGGESLIIDRLLANATSKPEVQTLDRWKVTIDTEKKTALPSMQAYLGVGVDAQITLNFSKWRESWSNLFTSRFVNKYFWYFLSGSSEVLLDRWRHFEHEVELKIDGNSVQLPKPCSGLLVLNVDSFGGGVCIWNHFVREKSPKEEGFEDSNEGDGKLEVVGVAHSFQLGATRPPWNLDVPVRLGQGNRIQIFTKNADFPLQVDGEPRIVAANSEIDVSFLSRAELVE